MKLLSDPVANAVPDAVPEAYWSLPVEELLARLGSSPEGLSEAEAVQRLKTFGPNAPSRSRRFAALRLLIAQFRNPLALLLIFASVASILARETIDATVTLMIVMASVGVGFWREFDASKSLEKLSARLTHRSRVVRGGAERTLASSEIAPGDVVALSAGNLIPADGVLISATDFFVNQAVLTGEPHPVEKRPGAVAAEAGLDQRVNCVLQGSNVRSGMARCLVVRTGRATAYGRIAERLAAEPPETEFQRGARHFGYLLSLVMLCMVVGVLTMNAILGRPAIESLLFSIALAVGMTPEMLPAILSVNLAKSAKSMARHGVLVRRLEAIENLGSIEILCSDKTGTLTEGVVGLDAAVDPAGNPSDEVLNLAALNAFFETGIANPLDEAILKKFTPKNGAAEKIAEVPYDFMRKRLSIVARMDGRLVMITKGAVDSILNACDRVGDGAPLDATRRAEIDGRIAEWSARGFRSLAVATREVSPHQEYRDQEFDLQLRGFLLFFDPPKEGAGEAVSDLRRLGVRFKIITGDHELVARHVAEQLGLEVGAALTGPEIDALHGDALQAVAERTDLFARVDPNQKERVILALKKAERVVGFLGDGVNDAPALRAADVGLSVDTAVEVAREAADFVLLEKDLGALRRGILEGRKTFANTTKYVLATTSANLGNMLTMALSAAFLPFLPLTAGQILLNNFLSDIPAIGLASDAVDPEMLERPQRWRIGYIRRFMIQFGALSSLFDLLTFAVVLWIFRAPVELFRTAWFVESLMTELLVALVVRTRGPFYRSRPGRFLLVSTLMMAALDLALPYVPFMSRIGFTPPPASMMASLMAITILYVAATEAAKRRFYAGRRDVADSAGPG